MKKIFYLVTLILIATWAGSIQTKDLNPLMLFKERVDMQDSAVYERGFESSDALKWWQAADDLMVLIYSNLEKGDNISEYNKEFKPDERKMIEVNLLKSKVGSPNISISYYASSPIEEVRNKFSAYSIPLDSSGTIYYLVYDRLWDSQFISSFHIMQLNKKTGKYEITAKLEQSNFYKNLALTGQLKYWPPWQQADSIPPYLVSGGSLMPDSIKLEGEAIKFDTHWGRCRGGGPCYDDMVISWTYSNKKLHATHYVDKYQSGWNDEKQQYDYKEERVELSP